MWIWKWLELQATIKLIIVIRILLLQIMHFFPSVCYLYKYPSFIIAASSVLVSSRVWAWTLLLTLLTGRLLAWLGRRRPSVGTGHHPVPLFRCWSAGCLSGCTQATSTSWLNHKAVRKTSWQTPSWRLALHRRSRRLKHCHIGGRQRDD